MLARGALSSIYICNGRGRLILSNAFDVLWINETLFFPSKSTWFNWTFDWKPSGHYVKWCFSSTHLMHTVALMQISKDFHSIWIDLIDWLYAQFTPHSVQMLTFPEAFERKPLVVLHDSLSHVVRSIKPLTETHFLLDFYLIRCGQHHIVKLIPIAFSFFCYCCSCLADFSLNWNRRETCLKKPYLSYVNWHGR